MLQEMFQVSRSIGQVANTCGHVIRTAATEIDINILRKPQNASCFATKEIEFFFKKT